MNEQKTLAFEPAALLFVGVAGALRSSVALGDIVVATHVNAYHGGTSRDDGLKARPRVWEISHRVLRIAQHLSRTGEWTRERPPEVAAYVTASGLRASFQPGLVPSVVFEPGIPGEAGVLRRHLSSIRADLSSTAMTYHRFPRAQPGHSGQNFALIHDKSSQRMRSGG